MSLTTVVFYVGYQAKPLTHNSLAQDGVGGSETCLLQIANELHSSGEYNIIITGEVTDHLVSDRMCFISTSEYRNKVESGEMSGDVDRVVAINYINYLLELDFLTFSQSVFWLHNTEHFPWHRGDNIENNGDHLYDDPRMSVVVCVSDWQADIIKRKYPSCESRVRVIPNCIDLNLFTPEQTHFDRNDAKFIYSSEPTRGLEAVLDMWPDIKSLIPNASLKVFCPEYSQQSMYDIAEQYKAVNLQDVSFIGSVNKAYLYREMEQATYWLYPSDYPETFCLTALEMMYSKTMIICSDTGNLKSLCHDRAYMYNHQWPMEQQHKQILSFLDKIHHRKSEEDVMEHVSDAQGEATNYHVVNICEQWNELLKKHTVETFGQVPAFVITLKPNNKRNRKQWAEQLDNANVQYDKLIVFNAINGAEIDQEYLDRNGFKIYNKWKIPGHENDWWARDILPGELGCAISHYAVWNMIKEYQVSHAFIFEDDFIHSEQCEFNDQVTGQLPINWDMLYLGRNALRPSEEPSIEQHQEIVTPKASYNMHAYALSRTGVRKLLDQRFENQLMPVDEFIQCTYDTHDRSDLGHIWADSHVYSTAQDIFKQSYHPSQTETIHLGVTDQKVSPEIPKQDVQPVADPQPEPTKSQQTDEVTLFDYYSNHQGWLNKYIVPGVVNMDMDLLIDEPIQHVHCFRMFTDVFCDDIIKLAESRNAWTVDRHEFYPTTDMVLGELGLADIYDAMLAELVEPVIRYVYQLDGGGFQNMNNENFLAKYTAENQSHLKIHHDMADITALVNLSSPDHDFEGGGTYFPKYKALYRPARGSMSVHPGNITHKHGARPVYSGTRYVLVSFMKRTT